MKGLARDLGLSAWVLEFRIWGLRVWDLRVGGFVVQGLGPKFRVQGLLLGGFRSLRFLGFRGLHRSHGLGFRV